MSNLEGVVLYFEPKYQGSLQTNAQNLVRLSRMINNIKT